MVCWLALRAAVTKVFWPSLCAAGGVTAIAQAAFAQAGGGVQIQPQINPGDNANVYVILALATSALGAIGVWLSPLIRDAMATRRYTSDASLYARELRRWAQYVSRSHPDLPAVPEPPRGWDDHGSLAGESSQDA